MSSDEKNIIQLAPQFSHEPQARLAFLDTVYLIPYSLVNSLHASIVVSSVTTHFKGMSDLKHVLLELLNQMGAENDG